MNGRTVVACLLVLVVASSTCAGGAEGRADLSATLPENRVTPGETAELEVQIMNSGVLEEGGASPATEQPVTTARGVRAELRAGDAPVSVRTAKSSLGAIPDGGVTRIPVVVAVDEDASPGRYRLPVEVRYDYTEAIDEETGARDERTVRETLYVTLRIEASPRFSVVDVASGVPPLQNRLGRLVAVCVRGRSEWSVGRRRERPRRPPRPTRGVVCGRLDVADEREVQRPERDETDEERGHAAGVAAAHLEDNVMQSDTHGDLNETGVIDTASHGEDFSAFAIVSTDI